MTSVEIQRAILRSLRWGKLDHFQIAADITQAPFRVRAELKTLRRERLVRDELAARGVLWELTSLGYEAAFHNEQLELGGAA